MIGKISILRFGEKLRKLRLQHNMTLKELAASAGYVAHGYISELEAGKKMPSLEFVVSIAYLFNVTTDQLLYDTLNVDTMSNNKEKLYMASLAFIHRPPSFNELERFRLILSTYQDGTGMLVNKRNPQFTLPGWRDFERSIALAFNGEALENKYVFDVLLPAYENTKKRYGLSCKMRGELNRIDRDGRVSMEISNSSGKFWIHLSKKGINQNNYRNRAQEVGEGLLDVVERLYQEVNLETRIDVDIQNSYYLTLSWNWDGWYQLHQFPLTFPSAEHLNWYCPVKLTKNGEILSRRINGDDEQGTLFEWYGESGGQLKYYPFASNAIWVSKRFQLEPLGDIEHGTLAKAAAYFPELWSKVNVVDKM
jgi:transcriptional regulator with XRE-family HTH domain